MTAEFSAIDGEHHIIEYTRNTQLQFSHRAFLEFYFVGTLTGIAQHVQVHY